jgi:RNA polymerase sigma factor (sigma-70 family)
MRNDRCLDGHDYQDGGGGECLSAHTSCTRSDTESLFSGWCAADARKPERATLRQIDGEKCDSSRSGKNVAAANWELVEAHRRALSTFLRGKCPHEEDIEDCVQEAMLRVAQLPEVDPRRLHGLLKTVAYNLAMDMHRDRRRQAAAFARIGTFPPPPPDVVALDSWEARSLADHARRLSFRERAALRGRADGFAPQETAALLGDTPKSIHLALGRARTSLRRLAGAAGAVLLWLRRHGRGTVRLTAPSMVAVTLGLALLGPRLHDPHVGAPPATAPTPAVAGMGWRGGAPAVPPLPRHSASTVPAKRGAGGPGPTVPGSAPDRRTIVAAHAQSPNIVDASAGVVEVNPSQPLLTGVENCLAPGAISLSGHNLGCGGGG